MRLLIPLFSPATGTWGGLTRAVAVAEAAKTAGHEVAFCAAGYIEQALRKRGYRVYSTPPTTMFGLPKPISRLIERRSQNVSPPVKPGTSFHCSFFQEPSGSGDTTQRRSKQPEQGGWAR